MRHIKTTPHPFRLKRLRRWMADMIAPAPPILPPEPAIFPANADPLMMQLRVTSDGLLRSAQAINDVTTQQSSGMAEQAEVILRTNALLDNFISLSDQIREQGHSMTVMAKETAEVSQKGQIALRQAIDGIREIRVQVSTIADTIVRLAQLTQRIDEIITSVSEIATQSNLLALNASIEAARAGAQGRGFAVVADEVRSLSQQSTQAAQQVRSILIEIQSAMKETVQATEIGVQGVDAGVAMTQQADTVMVQLAESVTASHEAVNSIYAVIRQQVDDLEQITIGVERIDRITRQNLLNIRMVETVSNNLARLAAELQMVSNLDTEAVLSPVDQNTDHDGEDDAGNAEENPH